MTKKKQKVVEDSVSTLDLKSLIHDHSLFFDKLVELIPPKFYLPADDDKPWFQGLSKAQKAAAKKQSRENIKKARRDRLDPEKSATTLDLLKQSIRKNDDHEDGDDDDDNVGGVKALSSVPEDDRSVTYEELRLRLRRRIEELRGNRNNGTSERAKRRVENSDKKGNQQKKRKRDDDSDEKKSAAEKLDKDVDEAAKELAFSHVKLGDEDGHGKKKKKKLSKLKELERAKKLEEAKKDPEKGRVIADKHSWQAATSRAAGVKVHDNPSRLKESIKKEKKKREKNAEKWKGRYETTNKMKAEKQKKRDENIAERKHQKKMRKIEKREKKLLRPGFEGRKEGFLNEPST